MKVFKFGGASVKDAAAVRNLHEIISLAKADKLVVVVSAMGKTTNALEEVLQAYIDAEDWKFKLHQIKAFHEGVINELVPKGDEELSTTVNKIFDYLNLFLESNESDDYDFLYDQTVSTGELLSTKIISAYLNQNEVANAWWDARKLVATDNRYRQAEVNWEATDDKIAKQLDTAEEDVFITQGFIGGGEHNRITTLGREGSDYSAAIFACCCNAADLTIWKDVPGMLNADPKYFNNPKQLKNISYREAVELAYFGATIIHPKTIKPLQNKGIPLQVKSFVESQAPGTLINADPQNDGMIPSYIYKVNQILITLTPRDFSFVNDARLGELYMLFADSKVRINMIQLSAINASLSADNDQRRLPGLIKKLQEKYEVLYNDGLELLTIRHYNEETMHELTKGRKVLMEQRTRNTVRYLLGN